MQLELTKAQTEIKQSARDFAEKYIAPAASQNDAEELFPHHIISELAPIGLLAPTLSKTYGGLGLDYISEACVFEEIGRACSSVRTILSVHNSLVCLTINQWGTDQQKKRFLPELARGEYLGCFSLTEHGSGSDAVSQTVTARLDGNDWVINGQKAWITSGTEAGLCLLFAQTDASKATRGITAFLLSTNTPGFQASKVTGKTGLRSAHTAHFELDNVRIPTENVLGDIGEGFKIAMSALDNGRYGVAAGCVGQAQDCLDASIEYVSEREAFGKPLAGFQLIQEMIAEMAMEIEAARMLVFRAGHKKNLGEANTLETSMAKLYASELAVRAARNAIQIHGALGYTNQFTVERHLRDALAATIYEGTSQIQKLIIGRQLTGHSAFV